jgi:Holliday junction resolvase RusA-like endonuclease
MKTYHRNVFVDYLPPMNTAHTRRHWSVAHKEKQQWVKLMLVAFPKKKMPDQPLTKSQITITRMSSREPDFDNMVMAAKPIFDALKKHGVIIDDAPRNVKREYKWRKERAKIGTLIEISGI